ncbi:MAG: hypothetical protein JWN74_1224 [Acidobacteriaceae bacterium]|nr:hypothetical protein [Acidobacteriaceae bacterium]
MLVSGLCVARLLLGKVLQKMISATILHRSLDEQVPNPEMMTQ